MRKMTRNLFGFYQSSKYDIINLLILIIITSIILIMPE